MTPHVPQVWTRTKPHPATVPRTGVDKDMYVMLVPVTSKEVSFCSFAGTSLFKGNREQKPYYQNNQLSGHLLHKPFH